MKSVIIILVLTLLVTDADAQRRRKRHRKHKFTKERVSVHRVTKTEKIVFATVALGLLAWSYKD